MGTCFNDLADKFDCELSENCVYECSKAQIKVANQKYTSIKNQYSLVFDKNSLLMKVDDDMEIQKHGFSFRSISEI